VGRPARYHMDYTVFGKTVAAPTAADPKRKVIDMVFEKVPRGRGKFNLFLVNGKEYPTARSSSSTREGSID